MRLYINRFRNMRKLFCALTLLFSMSVGAADIHVTPDSSLADAVRKAREIRRMGQAQTVTIHLAKGVYRLYEPLRLRPEDSGLVIEGDDAIIS